jgi:hypothetical protein
MGSKRRQGNASPQKTNKNSIEDLVESEGNESPVADLSRMMIRCSMSLKRSLKKTYKNSSKNVKRTRQENLRRHRNNLRNSKMKLRIL